MNTTHAAGQDRAILPPLADGASTAVYTGCALGYQMTQPGR